MLFCLLSILGSASHACSCLSVLWGGHFCSSCLSGCWEVLCIFCLCHVSFGRTNTLS